MKVLLAEDEVIVLWDLETQFKEAKHQVVAWVRPPERWLAPETAYEPGTFDLIVTDFNLGRGVNGGQIIDKIRETDSNVPCVIISAERQDITRWQNVAFISKPVNGDVVSKIMESIRPFTQLAAQSRPCTCGAN